MKPRTGLLKRWTVSVLAGLALLGVSGVAAAVTAAVTVTQDSGPNIKTELFRSDGASALIWEEISFTFPLPVAAIGDGVFNMFAGGDLNNLIDQVSVTSGAVALGSFTFPVPGITCGVNPAPAGCPVPETVPGGLFFDASRGGAVGDVKGSPSLTVPFSLLSGKNSITLSLLPSNDIFDLYIDRLELTFPIAIPEPSTWLLVTAGLALLAVKSGRRFGHS